MLANLPPSGWKLFDPIKDFSGTADRAGICGDEKGANDHMIGGSFMPYSTVPIMANWKKGGLVDLTAELDTNHNGFFEFHLCNLDRCAENDISPRCFTQGHCYKLERVAHPDCEDKDVDTTHDCGPIDPENKGRWYVPCRRGDHVGVHIVGGPSGTMRYRLPPNVECKHCVLQWYWATANSCAPPGFLAFFERFSEPFGNSCPSDGGGLGAYRKGMETCSGRSIPEEFWSCADVQITKDGKSAGPVQAVGDKSGGRSKPSPTPMAESPSATMTPMPTVSTAMPEPSPEASPQPAGNSDEEELARDRQGVFQRARRGLRMDLLRAANKPSSEKEKERADAENGLCYLEGEECDGKKSCCDKTMVCVQQYKDGTFVCRFWWSLWKDSEARQAS